MSAALPPGYELRGAREDEMQTVLHFIESVFHMAREYFFVRYRRYPDARAEHSRIVLHEGRPVAHQRLYRHDLQFAGAEVSAWAIGDVCTDPEHRRKRLGNVLLEDCATYAREHGAALVLIRASLFAFYCTLGWDSFPLPAATVTVGEVPPSRLPTGGYVTRTFEEPWDLWQVAEVHRRFCAGRSLVRLRDGRFWDEHRVWCPQERGQGFVVAGRDGRIAAYGRLWERTVTELCYLPGHEQAGVAVMEALLRLARVNRHEAIRVPLPADHAVLAALAGLPGVEMGSDDYTLLRLVHLRRLFEQTLGSLGARLRQAGMALSAPLTIRCLGRQVTLVPQQGYLTLSDAPSERVVELTQRQLLGFGAGLDSPAEALGGSADPTTIAELEAMFPRGNPIYWISDNV